MKFTPSMSLMFAISLTAAISFVAVLVVADIITRWFS